MKTIRIFGRITDELRSMFNQRLRPTFSVPRPAFHVLCPTLPVRALVGALTIGFMIANQAQAASGTWDGGAASGSGSWSTPANWNPDGNPANGATLTFGASGTSGPALDTGTFTSVGGLTFTASTAAYTINQGSGGTLTLSGGIQQLGTVTVTMSNGMTLSAGNTMNVSQATGALTLAGILYGTGSITKLGSGTLSLGTISYTGTTTIDQGTLTLTGNSTAGTLTFGLTDGSTTVGNLNLSSASGTFTALTSWNNSATANTITIGSGNALTIKGPVTIATSGSTGSGLTINGSTVGAGTFAINTTGDFNLGYSDDQTQRTNVLDMRNIGTFTASVGNFQLGYNYSGSLTYLAAGVNTLYLAPYSSITANTLEVGGPTTPDSAQVTSAGSTLYLGTGNNIINATTITVAENEGNPAGEIQFTGSGGALSLKGKNGTGSVTTMTIGWRSDTGSGNDRVGIVDLSNGTVTGGIGTLYVGSQTGGGNPNSVPIARGTFKVGAGTAGAASVLSIGNVYLGYANDTNGDTSSGTLELDGGSLTVTGSIEMTHNTAPTANLIIAGGTLSVGGNITSGNGASTITLNGGVLNMGSFNIGALGNEIDTFNYNSGTLANFGSGYIGAMVYDNSSYANTITIGSGKTLTINGTGGLRVGDNNGAGSATVNTLTITGSGALLVANTAAIVTIGLNQGTETSNNNGILDLTGLSGVTLGSSSTAINELRIAYGQMASGTLKLSNTAATITATTIRIGDSNGANNGTGYLNLGTGYNDINADTIDVGLSKAGGTLKFASQTAGSAGTVTIGGKTGATADIYLGYGATWTTGGPQGTMDLRGHLAYVTADGLTMGYYNQTAGGSSASTGTLYFDGGTFTVNTINMAANNTAGGTAKATINVSGGTFTVNSGGAFTLASQTGAGAASGTLSITGGMFVSNVAILDGGTTTTSTITLNGGTATLNMTGHNIGSAANPINALNFQSGTLANAGAINGTAGFTKDTSGTLTLAGTFASIANIGSGTLRTTSTIGGTISMSGGTLIFSSGSGNDTATYGGLTLSSGIANFWFNGSNNDQIYVTNSDGLTINGGTLSLNNAGTGTFYLINYSGDIGGTGVSALSVSNPTAGKSYSFAAHNDWVTLTISGSLSWNSGGTNDRWSTAANWGGTALTAGVALNFGSGARVTPDNDFAANTQFAGINFLGSSPAFTLSGNDVNLINDVVNNSANNQTINLDLVLDGRSLAFNANTGTLTINGILSEAFGSWGVLKNGGSATVLNAANTFTGETDINAGRLIFGNADAAQYSTVNINVNNGLGFSGGTSFTLGGLAGSGSLSIQGLGITFGSNNANTTYSGLLSGAGSLTKLGTGTFVINNAGNTYSGGTWLNAGVISFGTGALGTTGSITMNGGTLQWVSGNTQDISARLWLVNNTVATFDASENDVSFATAFKGGSSSASLVKMGSGTLLLTAANSFTGGSTITAGVVSMGGLSAGNQNDNSLGTGTVTINAGGELIFGGNSGGIVQHYIPFAINLNGGVIYSNDGYQHITQNLAVGPAGGTLYARYNTKDLDFEGVVSGTGNLTVTYTGGGSTGNMVHFGNSANTYSGTVTVNNASTRLALDDNNALSDAIVNVTANDVLRFGTGVTAPTLGGLMGSGSINIAGVGLSANNNDSSTTYSGILSGAGSLTKVGAGKLTLSGNNTYSGGTTINTGTLQIGAGGATGTLPGNALNKANLVFSQSDGYSYGSIISGAGNVIQAGTGSLTFTVSNTYSGTTMINSGTLLLSGSGSIGRSATIQVDTNGVFDVSSITYGLNSGQTLQGGGTIAGNVTAASGSAIHAGNGLNTIGSLTFTNNLMLSSGANVCFDVLNSTGSLANDYISVGGSLTLSNGSTITINPLATLNAGTYTLFRYAGTLANNATVTGNNTRLTWNLGSTSASNGILYLIVSGNIGSLTWTGATDNSWIVGTTPQNWTDGNNGGAVAGFLNLDDVMFTNAGLAKNTVTITGSVMPNTIAINTTGSYTYTGTGSITGSGTLTLTAGTLSINNANTDFSGLTKMNGGAPVLNNANALAGSLIDNGTYNNSLQFGTGTSGYTIGGLQNAGTITLQNANGGIGLAVGNNDNSTTFSGVLAGTGSLTKIASNTLTLSGASANTFSGGVTVSQGKLVLAKSTSGITAIAGGAVLVSNGATLRLEQHSQIADSVGVAITGGTFDLGGYQEGVSTITLSGGTITASGSASGFLIAFNGYTGSNNNTISKRISVRGANASSALFNITDGTTTVTGVIHTDSGAAQGITKTGGGALVLSGAGSFTGGATITGGVLSTGSLTNGGTFSGIGMSSSLAANLFINGGTLRYTGGVTTTDRGFTVGVTGGTLDASGTGGLTFNNAASGITMNAATSARTFRLMGSGSGTLAAAITDNGSATQVTKSGTGTWTLTGVNTYTGQTAINGGTLALGSSGSIGNSEKIVLSGGRFDVSAVSGYTLGGSQVLQGDNGTIVGNLTAGTGSTIYAGANVNTIGTLNFAGDLTLNSGNNVIFDLTTPGSGDLINVIGTLNLNSGTLTINPLNAPGPDGTLLNGSYALFSYGTLTGNFSGVVGNNSRNVWTLNTSTPNMLYLDVTGGSGSLTWNGTAGTWDLGSTVAWTNTGTTTPTATAFYQNDYVAFDNTGSLQPNVTLSGTLVPAAIVVNAGSYTLTGSGTIAGLGGLTVNSGTLTINTGHTFTGGATLSASGALNINHANALGTGRFTVNGGTIDSATASVTLATIPQTWNSNFAFTGSNDLNLGTGAVTLGNNLTITTVARTLTVGGPISGGFGLTKEGSGTLTLSGNSAFAGNVIVNAGTLKLTNSGALGTGTKNFYMQGTGRVLQLSNNITLSPSITLNASTNSGDGTGIANVDGSNTIQGQINIALGNGLLNISSIAGTLTLSGNITAIAIGRALVLGGASANANTVSGIVSDGSTAGLPLTKQGTGTWVLSGLNTYTGVTTISGGVLSVGTLSNGGGASGIGQSGSLASNLVIDGGTLRYTGTAVATSNRDFTLGASGTLDASGTGGLTLGSSGSLVAFSGTGTLALNLVGSQNGTLTLVVGDNSGSATALTKSGTGIWTLTGTSTFSGGSTISGGTLRLSGGADRLFAGGTVTIGSGTATFDVNGQSQTLAALIGTSGGSITLGTGTLTLNQGATTSSSFNGVISGGGQLILKGGGTLTLGGVNTYTGGTTIDNATLKITTANTGSGTLTFGATAGGTNVGVLDLGSASFMATSLTVRNNSTSANTITIGTGNTLSITGGATIGYSSAANTTTKLTLTGSGAFSAGSGNNVNFQIGGNTTSAFSNGATLDMNGLAAFVANLGTGTFRVGDTSNDNAAAAAGSTLILANTSTITAGRLIASSPDGGQTQVIKLGSGLTTINAGTISLGGDDRGTSSLSFNTTAGTLTLQGQTGVGSRAAMNVGYGVATTGQTVTGTVDLTGHSANLSLSTLNIGGRTNGGGGAGSVGTFLFDTGTLTVDRVTLGYHTGTASTAAGTLSFSGTAIANIGSIQMGGATAGGTGKGYLILGGSSSITMSGDITKMGGAGTTTAAITLNGASAILDMGSRTIGASGTLAIDTFNFQAGTLKNVAEFNAGGSITKSASTTATLAGNNAFTGGVNLSAGQLNLNSQTALGAAAGTFTIANGTTIDNTSGSAVQIANNNPQNWTGNFTFAGGNGSLSALNLGTGTVALGASSRTVTITDSTLTVGGTISGSAGVGLTKTGGGTLTLSGANTYSGDTTISAGTLQLSGGINRIKSNNNIIIAGTLDMGGNAQTFNSVTGGGSITTGGGGLTIGSAGASCAFSGVISDAGSLTKTGTGTLTLSGLSTYSGGTTISEGTLLVNNTSGSGTGSGLVTVTSGAKLGGTGTVGGDVEVETGAALTPGTGGAGTLNVGGNLTVTLDGALDWDSTDDQVAVGGLLTLPDSLVLNLGGIGTEEMNGKVLFTYATYSGPSSIPLSLPGESGTFQAVNDIANSRIVFRMLSGTVIMVR